MSSLCYFMTWLLLLVVSYAFNGNSILEVHQRSSTSFKHQKWCIGQLSVTMTVSSPLGAYIHIPFCRRRCFYCNFPIKILGERISTITAESAKYTDLLLREMKASTSCMSGGNNLETVYFGGGTPSLLAIQDIERILNYCVNLGVSKDCEITMEVDPGTFDLEYLRRIKMCGVNRLSMGVQSFDLSALKSSGRAHSPEDIAASVNIIRESNIENFSIDLISSLPGMTMKLWKETLFTASNVGSTHISVYDLQVEDKTAFGRWYTPGEFPLPTDAESAQMYRTAVEVLTDAGFDHYEISNYAKPGKRSRHNQMYWKCAPMWGFGMGAASFVDGTRFTRPTRMEQYASWVETLEMVGLAAASVDPHPDGSSDNELDAVEESMSLSSAAAAEAVDMDGGDKFKVGISESKENVKTSTLNGVKGVDALDVVMLSLRTSDGLDLDALGASYGPRVVDAVCSELEKYSAGGFVQFGSKRGIHGSRRAWLTDPEGFLISNDIISSVFAVLMS